MWGPRAAGCEGGRRGGATRSSLEPLMASPGDGGEVCRGKTPPEQPRSWGATRYGSAGQEWRDADTREPSRSAPWEAMGTR